MSTESPCPVCHSPMTPRHRQVRDSAFAIHQCSACGAQALRPTPTWDQIKAIYSAEYYRAWGMAEGETTAVADMKKSTFRRRLRQLQHFAPAGRILDVGTASGFFLEVAREFGYEPYGIELSDYSAGLAKAKFGTARIWHGTLETAPFEPATFAAVAMSDLLEHVTDPVATLQRASHLLRPGGVVLVMTPNIDSLTNRLMGQRWSHYKVEHLTYFGRRSIAQAARSAGMEVVFFRPAVKSLTLGYVHTQMLTYPHWLLTPVVRALHAVGFFARNWPVPVVIGEFVAILRKP